MRIPRPSPHARSPLVSHSVPLHTDHRRTIAVPTLHIRRCMLEFFARNHGRFGFPGKIRGGRNVGMGLVRRWYGEELATVCRE